VRSVVQGSKYGTSDAYEEADVQQQPRHQIGRFHRAVGLGLRGKAVNWGLGAPNRGTSAPPPRRVAHPLKRTAQLRDVRARATKLPGLTEIVTLSAVASAVPWSHHQGPNQAHDSGATLGSLKMRLSVAGGSATVAPICRVRPDPADAVRPTRPADCTAAAQL